MTAVIWASETGHDNVVKMLQAAGARYKGHGKKVGAKVMLIQVPELILKCLQMPLLLTNQISITLFLLI